MMNGHAFGWGWMWFAGIVLILILAALIVLIVRASMGGAPSTGRVPSAVGGSARQIAEERLARGEISPDEFRQIARALDERT